jgi:hypothetical protein
MISEQTTFSHFLGWPIAIGVGGGGGFVTLYVGKSPGIFLSLPPSPPPAGAGEICGGRSVLPSPSFLDSTHCVSSVN